MSKSPLAGQTAVVTGAGRRLGKAIALELARAGANVVVHVNTSLADGEGTVAEVRALGVKAALVRADQRNPVEIECACRAAQEALGPVRYLVNSAANWPHVALEKTTPEDFDLAVETNLRGPFFWARYLGPEIKRAGGGAIVNIADVTLDRPLVDSIPYALAKAGIITMTYALAKALAPEVRVNAVGPGPILLPENYHSEAAGKDVAATLLKRLGAPKDIAGTTRFLLESDYITGVFLPVDGGYRFGAQ